MMSVHETIKEANIGEVKVQYIIKYKVSKQTEECHGFHDMYDEDIIDLKLLRVVLELPNGELDITDRLNKNCINEIENGIMQ